MPRQTLTARYVEAVKPPASSRTEHWDASTPGFGLRVSVSGRKSWVLMYRHEGRLRRLTLGTYPALPLSEARERARDAIRHAAKGGDPAGDKSTHRRAETFADMAADYMERHAKLRKKSWHRDELMLQRDLLPWFGNHKAKAVSRRNVNALLDSIMDRGAPVQANRTLQILKRIYNWGISREIVEVNPCAMIRPPGEEKPRERVLSEDELQAVWHALEPEEALLADLFRLRILTAQRGGEVATMRRPDLDLAGGWWTIPAEFSKNGLSHRVPLSPWAIKIVEEALASADNPIWVFPSAMKDGPIRAIWQAINRIRRRSGVGFRPHDLRRTAASLMTGMGISRLVVAKILNHVDPSITAVYDRHGYDHEKRQALEAWSARVQQLVTGQQAKDRKVVPLRQA